MKFLSCLLLMTFLAQTAALAGDVGLDNSFTSVTCDGDQFERAMLDVIAAAAREGKKITVKRVDSAPGEAGIAVGPAQYRAPMTSVIAVDIRDPKALEDTAQRLLLTNQEEIIKALNVICEGQLDAGGKLSSMSSVSSETDQAMRGVSSDVDRVNEGVSATYSEVADVSEVTLDSAGSLESIKKELENLNQTVQSLLSSMGGIEEEISALASGTAEGADAGEESGDTGCSSEGESTESSGNGGGDESESECSSYE
ncbi:MAG: hypothetical protein P9M00_00600 [Candidatus Tritonobacter lacicola]|nr:hypothetical protein [Candidatus Tritonobacter lacicola]